MINSIIVHGAVLVIALPLLLQLLLRKGKTTFHNNRLMKCYF